MVWDVQAPLRAVSLGEIILEARDRKMKNQAMSKAIMGQTPAAVKIADEIQQARASGDWQRVNDLQMSAKMLDKGIVWDEQGNAAEMSGYGQALGGIKAQAAGMSQNAKNQSDLNFALPTAAAKSAGAGMFKPQEIHGPDGSYITNQTEAMGGFDPSAFRVGNYNPDAPPVKPLPVGTPKQPIDMSINENIVGSGFPGPKIDPIADIARAENLPPAMPPRKQLPILSPADVEREKITGKADGEAEATLANIQASLPRLTEVTKKLHTLGMASTYTMTGAGRDAFLRETGLDIGDPAVARNEYIKTVDNEILPLLRDTFGAQFTKAEGDSLRATLGDPNLHPKEKDAALRAFLESKIGQVQTLQRRTGKPVTSKEELSGGLYQKGRIEFDSKKGAKGVKFLGFEK